MPAIALPEGFEEAVMSMSEEEVKERMNQLTRAHLEHAANMKLDEELKRAAAAVKEMRKKYTGPIGEIKAQVAYCHKVLNERGRVVEVSSDD